MREGTFLLILWFGYCLKTSPVKATPAEQTIHGTPRIRP